MEKNLSFTLDFYALGMVLAALTTAALLYLAVRYFKNNGLKTSFFVNMFVMSILSLVSCGATVMHLNMDFHAHVKDYIVAAYNADTPEEAKMYFDRAVNNLNQRSGSTAVLYKSPQYDVNDWYKKVSDTQESLNVICDTQFVSDEDKPGKHSWAKAMVNAKLVEPLPNLHVNLPNGIATHPYNPQILLWLLLTCLGIAGNGVGILYKTWDQW